MNAHVAQRFLTPLARTSVISGFHPDQLCAVHPLRKMNVVNGVRQMAYGDICLSTVMLFDQLVIKIINSAKFEHCSPMLRHTVFNSNYTISSPLYCSCTMAEKQIPYTSLPQVIQQDFENEVTDELIKRLLELFQVDA